MTRGIAIAVVTLLCAASAAHADQVMLSATKDNTIYSEGTTLSNGAGNGIFAGRTGPNSNGAIRRALIAFDIAGAIPAGSTITSVELKLRVAMTQAGERAVGLLRLLADWGESTSNADGGEGMGDHADTGDATWRFRFYSDVTRRWTTDGGDFVSGASAIETVGDIGSLATWGSTPMMVADVQGWLDAPATNFGWLIRDSEDTVMTTKKFHSRQAVIASNRPQLLIVFDPPVAATATVSVPPSATITPPASATATSTRTETAASTRTATAVPTVTVSASATATATVSASATHTATPTQTGSATATATQTVGATATVTKPMGTTATETPTVPTPTATASQPTPPCVGDCDGSGTVIINELITGVNIALDRADLTVCRAFDATGDGKVTINELIAAVGNALGGC